MEALCARDRIEMLKLIICTYAFRNMVDELANDGIDFNKHFYVPSIDTKTGLPHHETVDHNHVNQYLHHQ